MTRHSLWEKIRLRNKTAVVTDDKYYSRGKMGVLKCYLAE